VTKAESEGKKRTDRTRLGSGLQKKDGKFSRQILPFTGKQIT